MIPTRKIRVGLRFTIMENGQLCDSIITEIEGGKVVVGKTIGLNLKKKNPHPGKGRWWIPIDKVKKEGDIVYTGWPFEKLRESVENG